MFSNNNQTPDDTKLNTLISAGSDIVGDLHFRGHLQVDGRVFGNLIADDESGASVRITETGCVVGELSVPNIRVSGKVSGNVHSCESLELSSKAVVEGNVHYNVIEVELGAQIIGNLHHSYRGKKEDCPAMPKTTTQPKPVWKTELADIPAMKVVNKKEVKASEAG